MKRIFSIRMLSVFALFLQSMPIYSRESHAEKLNELIINKVVFDETDVVDAFEFLRKRSKEKNPCGKGINIVLMGLKKGERSVTLELTDVPAGDLIRYICIAAGLEYKIEQFAVIISKEKNK